MTHQLLNNEQMDTPELLEVLSTDGLRLLDSLPPYETKADVLKLVSELRAAGHSPTLVAAVLSQSKLRAKATAKFGPFAARMLFTEAGLEQATRFTVAARHAQRFAAAGIDAVADLTTGIGGDSMAMAALGLRVLGFELDELTAAIATVNLRHFPDAEVRYGDAIRRPRLGRRRLADDLPARAPGRRPGVLLDLRHRRPPRPAGAARRPPPPVRGGVQGRAA